ncbi:MAG: hypothetical protein LBC18_01230 [Opitutaceae bacterium]|nr:hypothetical protein [Opitutaceae bacterium]
MLNILNKSKRICTGLALSFKREPLLWTFIALAVTVRVFFWFYTGRVWEDYLITATGVENAWNGFGLTHHAGEPRVHYFTSPVSVLIPLALHPVMNGLLAMRLAGLLAAAGTIWLACNILKDMGIKPPAMAFVLAFLSFDFLHVFFGMSGMETQVSVFFVLLAMRCHQKLREGGAGKKEEIRLGIALGLCMLGRPDFIIVCACIGLFVLCTRPKSLAGIAGFALLVYLPWFVFTMVYYGSPVPNTIIAKGGSSAILTDPAGIVSSFFEKWHAWAPIYEWWWVSEGGGGRSPLLTALAATGFIFGACMFLTGAAVTFARDRACPLFAIVFMLFVLYNCMFVHTTYYMWYLPPFTALAAMTAAIGINAVFERKKAAGWLIVSVLVLLYLLPLPFLFSIEKQAQEFVENGVRKKVGERLSDLMGDTDTAVLEPLGYIGYYGRNKTIYDMPGLGSKIAVASLKKRPAANGTIAYGLAWLCQDLRPSFAVLRPAEHRAIREILPDFDKEYQLLETIGTQNYMHQSGPLVVDRGLDACFIIFRRDIKQAPSPAFP